MNAVTSPKREVRVLKAKKATPEALAPYGEILGYNPNVKPLPIDFYGGKAKVRRVVNFESDGDTEMPVVTVDVRPLEVSHMERHPKHTQAFISLQNKPFVVVFAPPSDAELPEVDKAEAFLFDGESGFVMKKNCWHEFPFALFDGTNLLVVLRKEATNGLTTDQVYKNEAVGPDLVKRDLEARFGLSFKVEI
ncbi:MAG: ureidoglycolate lyase [Steroidobacteraceae bacterium]|jgi:ureidoglycolate lyase|nr:ureidoglycolate lyase [Steroidobacteraceae bacterium]